MAELDPPHDVLVSAPSSSVGVRFDTKEIQRSGHVLGVSLEFVALLQVGGPKVDDPDASRGHDI